MGALLGPPRMATRPSRLRLALAGAGLGLGWGVAARAWMRLISTDPEFSWSGTGYILGACTVVGLLLGAAEASRRRGTMGWWRTTGASALLLGVGAGMIVLPTALLGGLAAARRRWHPAIRAVLALAAAVPAVLVARGVWDTVPGLRGVLAIAVWAALAGTLALAFSVPFRRPAPAGSKAPSGQRGGRPPAPTPAAGVAGGLNTARTPAER
jgi:hypothetical protein